VEHNLIAHKTMLRIDTPGPNNKSTHKLTNDNISYLNRKLVVLTVELCCNKDSTLQSACWRLECTKYLLKTGLYKVLVEDWTVHSSCWRLGCTKCLLNTGK